MAKIIPLPGQRQPVEDRWPVRVTPRYLAGEGRCRCVAFAPLTRPTWCVERQGVGVYHAYGDNCRLYVGLLRSECNGEEYWHISAYRGPGQQRVWHMDFDVLTPPELIEAIAAALAADAESPLEPRPYLHKNHPGGMEMVWQPLADAGWTIICDGASYFANSPDGVTTLTYEPPSSGFVGELLRPEAWLLDVIPNPARDPLWCAMFHDDTPLHLIAAFTAALADPSPLLREHHQIPQSCRALINRT